MKIFGKRKTTTKPAPSSVDANDEPLSEAPAAASLPSEIPSYFSSLDDTDGSTKKKQRTKQSNNDTINGEEMEKLLAMDPEELNSKQRRLVRRFKERDAANDAARDIDVEGKSNEANTADVTSKQQISDNKDSKEVATASKQSAEPGSIDTDEKELLSQLEGLNSKDRRKLLRQLRNDNQDGKNTNDDSKSNHELIAKLEEEAKRIAERNIRESAEQQTTQSSKSQKEKEQTPFKALEQQQSTQSKKSKRKIKDLSDLPPEEIARREKQRQLQKEAAERRVNGEEPNTHRHPLNSERRRANRRKPAHRKSGSKKGEFNSVGYRMRRGV
ncbi:hypothetical protein HJC23_003156 [Cyclotella cryptica]|uniref:Uncharacterized protein n=1 Tax=Cyclotella cryptica TaxID=29204 RepID=A0ABD3PPA2_9STRA|eukprot:CCRYP_012825-RA/>CCRYP_012825-RA protein AED:0.40 eAED:0.40 QI:0/-1/0/1/-1/1/1/0/327